MTKSIGLALVLLLAGCGSFEKGFEEGFDKSFRESCREAAIKKGASAPVANQHCECTLAKFKETKSMDKSAEVCTAQVKSNPPPPAQ